MGGPRVRAGRGGGLLRLCSKEGGGNYACHILQKELYIYIYINESYFGKIKEVLHSITEEETRTRGGGQKEGGLGGGWS